MSLRIPAVAPKSRNKIEMEAIAFLSQHFPGHLKDPGKLPVLKCFELLDDLGLETGVEHLSDGVEGITLPNGQVFLSEKTYRGAHFGNGRDRFTVVHECYHALFHRSQIQFALIHLGTLALARKADIPPYRNPEWQANTFASSVLMPAITVRTAASRGSPALRTSTVASVFGVSPEAARIRLSQLGLA